MNLRKYGKSSLLILLGTMFGQAIGYVYATTVARIVGPLDFGRFSLLLGLISVGVSVTALGLPRTAVRYVAIFYIQNDAGHLKGTIWALEVFVLFTSLIFALFGTLSAPAIAGIYLNDTSLIDLVRISVWVVPIGAFLNISLEVLRGLNLPEYRTFIESTFNKCTRLALLIIGQQSMTVFGLIAIELASQALGLLVGVTLLIRRVAPLTHKAGIKIPYQDLVAFSLPMVPAGILTAFGNQTEMLILGWRGLVIDAGGLNAALRTASFGSVILLSLNSNFAPYISSLRETGKLDELGFLFRRTTSWQTTLMLAWCGFTILLASDILQLFGDAFVGVKIALILLSLRQLTDTILGPVGLMITMGGWAVLTFANTILYLVVSVAFDLVFIPRWGLLGAALAILLTSIIINLIGAIQVWHYYRIHALSFRSGGLTVSTIILVTLLSLIRLNLVDQYAWWLQILLVSIAFVIGYVWLLYKFLHQDDLKLIQVIIARAIGRRILPAQP